MIDMKHHLPFHTYGTHRRARSKSRCQLDESHRELSLDAVVILPSLYILLSGVNAALKISHLRKPTRTFVIFLIILEFEEKKNGRRRTSSQNSFVKLPTRSLRAPTVFFLG